MSTATLILPLRASRNSRSAIRCVAMLARSSDPASPKQDAGQTAETDAAPARPVASGGDDVTANPGSAGERRAQRHSEGGKTLKARAISTGRGNARGPRRNRRGGRGPNNGQRPATGSIGRRRRPAGWRYGWSAFSPASMARRLARPTAKAAMHDRWPQSRRAR